MILILLPLGNSGFLNCKHEKVAAVEVKVAGTGDIVGIKVCLQCGNPVSEPFDKWKLRSCFNCGGEGGFIYAHAVGDCNDCFGTGWKAD